MEYFDYIDFVCNRIAALRNQKAVSARDMSLSLGQSSSYINKIETGMAYRRCRGYFISANISGSAPWNSLIQILPIPTVRRSCWKKSKGSPRSRLHT